MKNFPSLLAVIGAWFCAFRMFEIGIIFFMASSLWAIIIHNDTDAYTLLFLAANTVAFFRSL